MSKTSKDRGAATTVAHGREDGGQHGEGSAGRTTCSPADTGASGLQGFGHFVSVKTRGRPGRDPEGAVRSDAKPVMENTDGRTGRTMPSRLRSNRFAGSRRSHSGEAAD